MAGRASAEPDATGPATVDDACDESAAEDGDELLDEQAARDKATATPIEQLTSGIGHGDLIGTSTISQATFPPPPVCVGVSTPRTESRRLVQVAFTRA